MGKGKAHRSGSFHLEIDIKLSPLRFFELLFPQRFISTMQSSTNRWGGDGDEVVSILKGSATVQRYWQRPCRTDMLLSK